MTRDRKENILIVFAYNCVMAALAFGAFAFSLWLLISGRLAQDGVDAVFLFAVGLVLAGVFSVVPVLSLRDGLLRDLRELWREGNPRSLPAERRPRSGLRESPVH